MKKTIVSLLMAVLATLIVVAAPAKAPKTAAKSPKVEAKAPQADDKTVAVEVTDSADDAAVVIHNGDTMRVKGASSIARLNDIINSAVNGALDDTLYNGNDVVVDVDDEDMDFNEMNEYWSKAATDIVVAFFFFLAVVVLLVVWFRYLTRRRKYHMIEKAIENNYPLTDAMLGDGKRSTVYVQQPVAAQQAQTPAGEPVAPAAPGNPAPRVTAMTDWSVFNPAIKWLGIGFGLLLFGIFCEASPFIAVGLALMGVGAAKGFIAYRQQQEMQQWRAQQPQQPQGEPMREGIPVPPPFEGNAENDNNEVSSFNN